MTNSASVHIIMMSYKCHLPKRYIIRIKGSEPTQQLNHQV